ncbi:MAG: imidazoleglycerol-phosphate dehydratase HisB [Clostridia bacterium]|nr:imidazoleglycerol-phosphate dehydratase HisB [Clostridia bacterium]
MRTSEINRTTKETDIVLKLNIDGTGKSDIDTGVGFFDHMLTLFASHGMFDLTVKCKGDLDVDAHHTVEDVGICLGKAFAEALGDMKGIKRYADKIIPMDEALTLVAVDISGRPHLAFDLDVPAKKVGNFDTELVSEFFLSFVRNAKLTLHIKKLAGRNTHHIIEGCFKAFGRTMDDATCFDPRREGVLPSTKGVL